MNVCVGASALAAAGLSLRELKDAMRAEETARLSKATQREYAVAESRDDSSWLAVTDALQRKILGQVGVPPARMAAALFVLRAAAQLFPDDPEMRTIPLQVRHNRARCGHLCEGDVRVDVPLYSMERRSTCVTMLSKACADLPTLVVAGSFT